ncbi:MAG: DUF5658 family protein [Terriglobales bacterium]
MKSALFTFLLLVGAAQAQQSFLTTNTLPDAPGTKNFWSFENKVDFSILAGQIAVDAITTQKGLNQGFRESNPVMRPLVTQGVAGQTAASALGFSAALGTAYLLHRTHHYRAERLATRAMITVEGGFVANNLWRLY